MNEIWLPIKGYEGHYEVSDLGRVRSIERYRPYRLGSKHMRLHKAIFKAQTPHYKNKYLSVLLKVDQVEKRVFVHRLVAEHFIPNPENKPEVNHKFGDKNDNRANSLEWATALENTTHSIATGLTNNNKPVLAIKETAILEFDSRLSCAKYLHVTSGWVGSAIKKDIEIHGHRVYNL